MASPNLSAVPSPAEMVDGQSHDVRSMHQRCIQLAGGKCVQLRGQTLFTITSDALFQLSISGHVDPNTRLADRTNLEMVAAQTIHQLSESGKLKFFADAACHAVSRSWLLVLPPTCGWRMCRLIAFTIHSLSVQRRAMISG